MNDLTNTLLPFIPEKYRPLVGALIVTSPLIAKDHSPIGAVGASNPESNSAAPIG
jgi:hypothetical protein